MHENLIKQFFLNTSDKIGFNHTIDTIVSVKSSFICTVLIMTNDNINQQQWFQYCLVI